MIQDVLEKKKNLLLPRQGGIAILMRLELLDDGFPQPIDRLFFH